MTVLSHNRGTVHSIFKICISRNMKCDKKVGFLKYSHILKIVDNSMTALLDSLSVMLESIDL